MPPLKNLKHEKFAKALAESKSTADAYFTAYDVKSDHVARVNASRLLANASVRERVAEILNYEKLDLGTLAHRLSDFVHSENEGIGLKAVETGFRLHGAFDTEQHDTNIGTINVIFGDVNANAQGKTDLA